VIHTLRDGLLAVDARGRITASNALFCELAGVPVALCAAGQPFAALEALDRDNAAPMLGGAATASRDGRQLEIWSAERTGGGKVWLVADVTRRTMAEAAARDASRMEAMGQLTGGLAHDFNNLLQVILASLDALDRDAAPAQRRRLEAMRDAANRGARLVRSLLAFARRQPLAPVPTDPNALVRDLADMVRQTVGEAIEVRTILAAGAWPVLVDPVQLESALLNLAANARDAMPQGGHLTIEVANISAGPAWAAQAQVPPGDYSLIAVSDTGTGMSPEVAARAFDPFFTTRAEAGGNGLGLSMVYGFARQSGGHARIYSEPGRGTTVKLILPRAAVEAALPRPPLPPIRHGKGERILLVEDNAAVRQATAEVIAELGYVVGQAANGTDALEMLRHERWDVLFTDVVMPGGIGGPELARQAAARQPGIRALFTSGYTQNGIVHGGRLDPGVRLVSKPAGRDELARALSATLAEGPQRLAVLVVDDEPLIRLAAADALAEAGHRVSEAGTVAEARAAADRTPPDVLVADLALPDGDGLALATELSARFPALRVVIASGRAPVSAGDEARMWLLKPYRSEELIAAVQRR
jgi:signal transduction histidine kinase/DNA-binding NarL/FixJ family response regulator